MTAGRMSGGRMSGSDPARDADEVQRTNEDRARRADEQQDAPTGK